MTRDGDRRGATLGPRARGIDGRQEAQHPAPVDLPEGGRRSGDEVLLVHQWTWMRWGWRSGSFGIVTVSTPSET